MTNYEQRAASPTARAIGAGLLLAGSLFTAGAFVEAIDYGADRATISTIGEFQAGPEQADRIKRIEHHANVSLGLAAGCLLLGEELLMIGYRNFTTTE